MESITFDEIGFFMNFEIRLGKYVFDFVFNFQLLNTKITLVSKNRKIIVDLRTQFGLNLRFLTTDNIRWTLYEIFGTQVLK